MIRMPAGHAPKFTQSPAIICRRVATPAAVPIRVLCLHLYYLTALCSPLGGTNRRWRKSEDLQLTRLG